ncbi:MAG: ABC transporter permease [Deltaproteobacteria bacterium]|nr:ABC transporter permease [Deltaproteobacteria bacterium]
MSAASPKPTPDPRERHPLTPNGRQIYLGVTHGSLAALMLVGLGRLAGPVPPGTRAQAVGACLATLAFLVSGFVLGVRAKGVTRGRTPFRGVLMSAFTLAFFGQWALGSPERTAAIFGADAALGLGRAALATARIGAPAFVLMSLGSTLGLRADRKTPFAIAVGGLVIAAVQALSAYCAFELLPHLELVPSPSHVELILVGGAVASFLVAGLVIAWALRKLAFTELVLLSLSFGYALYLVISVPGAEILASATIPTEQLLVALALAPTGLALCLLTVGSSIGFLFVDGLPRADFELAMALRYLRIERRGGSVIATLLLAFAWAFVRAALLPVLALAGFGRLILIGLGRRRSRSARRTAAQAFIGATMSISVTGVALGVMALIVVLSVMSGFEQDLKTKILGAHAHVVLGKLGDDFTDYEAVADQASKVEGVKTATPFVLGEGMISSEGGLAGVLVKGVDPTQPGVDELRKNTYRGKFDHLTTPCAIPAPDVSWRSLTSTRGLAGADRDPETGLEPEKPKRCLPGLVVGRELARSLRVFVGDTVSLVSPASEELGPTGPQPKLRRFRVAAVFFSGMFEFDSKFAYLTMSEGQRLFGKRGQATGVELRVADVDDTPRIVETVKRKLGGHPYTARDWREMNKELFSALLLEKLAMFIILTFIVLVASFLIVSTLVMIVLEKGKEIAILKSMGAPDASITKIFVAQGLVVGLAGALLGLIFGVGVCQFIEHVGIRLDSDVFYIDRLPVSMDPTEVVIIVLSAITITYLASIYPAITAAKLEPVEGLRDD